MKILIFSNGSKTNVVSEDGKYYYTKKSKFRKLNPDIADVQVVPDKDSANTESGSDKKKKSDKKAPAEKKDDKKGE